MLLPRFPPRALLMLLLLAVPGGVAAQGSPAFGPLFSEEGAPIHRFSFTTRTEGADLVEPGSVTAELWLGYSNVFEQDSSATHVVFIDMERLLTVAGLRIGIGRRLEVGGALTLESSGGGVLDPAIVWWHDLLHVGNANRDRFPENAYGNRLEVPGERIVFDVPQDLLMVHDLRLSTKWGVHRSEDGRRSASVVAAIRTPIRVFLGPADRTDLSLAVVGRNSWDRWHLHGMVGIATIRAAETFPSIFRDRTYSLTLAAERSLGRNWSGIAQYGVTTPVLHSFHHRELDWPSSNLLLGVAGRFGTGWRWDVSFQEDLPADTPAADFTLGIRVSRTW